MQVKLSKSILLIYFISAQMKYNFPLKWKVFAPKWKTLFLTS